MQILYALHVWTIETGNCQIVTIFEVLSGLASSFGGLMVLFYGEKSYGIIGLILAGISLSILMIGQRMSKDYDGAAVLVPYFLLTMFGLFIYIS